MNAFSLAKQQIVMNIKNDAFFFSYGTLIAKKENNKIYLDSKYWNYGQTTLKYLKMFLETNESKQEIKNNDKYIFVNLQEQ